MGDKVIRLAVRLDDGALYEPGEELIHLSSVELAARKFSTKSREKMSQSGSALPDGSFPIPDCDAARRARQALGRAPESKRSQVRAHIHKREKALGCEGGPIGGES